jgi:hypothetical protein
MLAIDIETLGMLDETPLPDISCICMYDDDMNISLRFLDISEQEYRDSVQIVVNALDEADRITGYNIVLFDLEYIKQKFHISQEKMNAWVKKCVDPFMCAKYILRSTCKLQDLLSLNNLQSKTGSGKDAITLARNKEWEKLLSYCMMDTILSRQLCLLKWIKFSNNLFGSWREGDGWVFKLNNSEIKYPVKSFKRLTLIENLNSMAQLQYNDDFIEYDADDEAIM